jgi:hypothetical protein
MPITGITGRISSWFGRKPNSKQNVASKQNTNKVPWYGRKLSPEHANIVRYGRGSDPMG